MALWKKKLILTKEERTSINMMELGKLVTPGSIQGEVITSTFYCESTEGATDDGHNNKKTEDKAIDEDEEFCIILANEEEETYNNVKQNREDEDFDFLDELEKVDEKNISVAEPVEETEKTHDESDIQEKREKPEYSSRQNSASLSEWKPQKETLLRDALYTVDSFMGQTGGWLLTADYLGYSSDNRNYSGTGASEPLSHSKIVTLDQVLQILSESFGVTEDKLRRIMEETRKRKAPEFFLELTVEEADIRCYKTSTENSNSHIKISILSGTAVKQRSVTRRIKGLRPKWMHYVKLKLADITKDEMKIELWNAEEERKRKWKFNSNKNHKKETEDVLLAELSLPLKATVDHGISGLYKMENRSGGNMKEAMWVKLTGNIVIDGQVECNTSEAYKSMLCYLMGRYIGKENPRGGEKICPCGHPSKLLNIPFAEKVLLSQYASVLILSYPSQLLAWWSNVTVKMVPVDWQLLLAQFRQIKDSLVLGVYTAEEQTGLQVSLAKVYEQCNWCITDMEACFPVAFPERSKTQLSSMLQVLRSFDDNPYISDLLAGNSSVRGIVKVALQTFGSRWCSEVLNNLYQYSERKDQLGAAVSITNEIDLLLTRIEKFYNDTFARELEMCCLDSIFKIINKEASEALRPVIEDCCQAIPDSIQTAWHDSVSYDFLKGSHLMEVYKNQKRLRVRCSHISSVMDINTGLDTCIKYFNDGICNQLDLSTDREFYLLKEVTLQDTLAAVGLSAPFSASLSEAKAVPHRMKIWWVELIWNSSEDTYKTFKSLLRRLLFLATSYCKFLQERSDYGLQQEDTVSEQLINEKVCVIMYNMSAMAKEMERFPKILGYTFQQGEKQVDDKTQRDKEVKTLVNDAIMGVESILREFMSEVIIKRNEFLERTIDRSCQDNEKFPFLLNILYPCLDLLRNRLESDCIKLFLERFWNAVIRAMKVIISKKSMRNPEFYGKMLELLQKICIDLTADSGETLNPQSAETLVYQDLISDLNLLEKTSSSLISLCYQEQISNSSLISATLVIKAWYGDNNRLVVNVLMAKDIKVPPERLHKAPLRYFVEINILSADRKTITKSTSTVKSDPATYDEEFEFNLKQANDAVHEGFMLITLKGHRKIHSNTILGEAFVPLDEIYRQDDPKQQYIYLKMIMPHFDEECKRIVNMLERRQDRYARAFMKKYKKVIKNYYCL